MRQGAAPSKDRSLFVSYPSRMENCCEECSFFSRLSLHFRCIVEIVQHHGRGLHVSPWRPYYAETLAPCVQTKTTRLTHAGPRTHKSKEKTVPRSALFVTMYPPFSLLRCIVEVVQHHGQGLHVPPGWAYYAETLAPCVQIVWDFAVWRHLPHYVEAYQLRRQLFRNTVSKDYVCLLYTSPSPRD